MDEYISKEFMLKNLEADKMNNAEHCEPVTIQIMERFIRYVSEFPAADVQPVDRWIDVNDRLPEEIGYYLVIIGNDMLYSIDIAEYSENHWHEHDRVIYWQDLPDYPKSIKGGWI